MKTRWMPIVMILALVASVLIALPASAANGGHTDRTLAPTVTTDQLDYPPGATVYITGAGFQPGETVDLQVLNLTDPTDTGDEHDPWPVTADTNGGFQATWLVTADEAGARLKLTAVGQTSGLKAETEFTDSITLTSVTVGSQTGTVTYGTAGSPTYTICISYAGNNSAITFSVISGLPAGATPSFSPTTTGNSPAECPTSASTLTVTTTAAVPADTYTFTVRATGGGTVTNTGTLVVGKKALSITAPTVTKVYDGGTTAGTVTVGTLSGFVGSETVTATGTATAYSSKNVGSSYSATVSYTLANGTNGGLAANYSLANSVISNAAITARALTITAQANTRTYDGGVTSATNASLTSGTIQSGDTAPTWTQTYDNKNAGSGKTLTPSSLKVTDGNSGNNYSYTYTAVSTGVIDALAVNLTGSRIWDGTATAVYSILSITNIVGGDSVNVASGSATLVSANVGAQSISSMNTLTLGGGAAGNYTLTGATGSVTITPGPVFTSHNGGGNWNSTATWDQGAAPSSSDTVYIANDTTVALNVDVTTTGSVTVQSGGTLNTGTKTLDGAGSFTVSSGGTLGIGSPAGIASSGATGNIQTTTRSFSTGANYTYNGSAAQVTGSGLPGTVNDLTVNNAAGVTLNGAATVDGTLTLTAGLLTLGANNLTIASSNAVAGGSFGDAKMIVADGGGSLCKTYSATGSYAFPIGDGSGDNATPDYSPATLNFTSGTFAGGAYACVKVTDGLHPNAPTGRKSYITRYWTTSSSDITFGSCDVTFTYDQSDVTLNGGATEDSIHYQHWQNPVWTVGAVPDTSNNILSATVSSFSDHTGFGISPTAVMLDSLEAVQDVVADDIDVTWATAQEIGNLGFNLWRGTSPAGPDVKLSTTIIPSQGPDSNTGFNYVYADDGQFVPGDTYYYWLEDIALDGTVTRHEPVSVTYLGPLAVTLSSLSVDATPGLTVTLPIVAALALAGVAIVSLRRLALARARR